MNAQAKVEAIKSELTRQAEEASVAANRTQRILRECREIGESKGLASLPELEKRMDFIYNLLFPAGPSERQIRRQSEIMVWGLYGALVGTLNATIGWESCFLAPVFWLIVRLAAHLFRGKK